MNEKGMEVSTVYRTIGCGPTQCGLAGRIQPGQAGLDVFRLQCGGFGCRFERRNAVNGFIRLGNLFGAQELL